MKPSVIHDVPATRSAMIDALGPGFGALFIANPNVAGYGTVLLYGDAKVLSLGDLRRGLRRAGAPPVLLVGRDFTLEARHLAADEGCDVLAKGEFCWSDAAYAAIRNNLHRS